MNALSPRTSALLRARVSLSRSADPAAPGSSRQSKVPHQISISHRGLRTTRATPQQRTNDHSDFCPKFFSCTENKDTKCTETPQVRQMHPVLPVGVVNLPPPWRPVDVKNTNKRTVPLKKNRAHEVAGTVYILQPCIFYKFQEVCPPVPVPPHQQCSQQPGWPDRFSVR